VENVAQEYATFLGVRTVCTFLSLAEEFMPHASFDGLRVLSLESRRAREVERLIRTYNGEPFVVPAMREVPLESNAACLQFAADLLAGRFDLLLFLTGVGVRAMMDIVTPHHDREAILAALRRTKIVVRGVKPQAALRDLAVPITAMAGEPSTWREVIQVIDRTFGPQLANMRVAVQEYGATNPELIAELSMRTESVVKVPVYQWALPLDLAPLREAVLAVVYGNVDVVLFMTAVQAIHLFRVAEEMGMADDLRRGLAALVVVSIGPTTSEELQHYRIAPDFEPSRPKMGFLVNEAAQYAGKVLAEKRATVQIRSAFSAEPAEADAPRMPATPVSAERGVTMVASSTSTMAGFRDGLAPFNILHEISSRIALADPLHLVLERIVAFVSAIIPCDSCLIYTREDDKLILRASKNPHADILDRLGLAIGEGLTGWVAQHREPVAISARASEDPRFSRFVNLPEDRFEAILSTPILCASRVVGVINLQHRESYVHTDLQVRLLSTIGYLVGAEVERARLETENSELANRLETRKTVDRAKGVLQRDLGLSEEEAYRRMQKESRQRRKSMREIAEAILLSSELRQTQT
jgi:uroporphyrinogen-III synthase